VPILTREELRWLVAVPGVAVFTPPLIVVLSLSLILLASVAGQAPFKLPAVVYFLYLALILASPPIGLATLVLVRVHAARSRVEPSDLESRLRGRVVVAAVLAVLLDVLWVPLIPLVVFASGRSR
jgi:hypothetical protein